MQHRDVQRYLAGVGVEWSFNVERAPWWGGVFERMVRMTKRCLKKMVGRAKLTYDELLTAVTEVEAVINSRPLSYVSSDDFEQPLTPAHLISGRRLLSLPDAIYCRNIEDDFETTPQLLTKRLIYLNTILKNFWRRWQSEYLLELREAQRQRKKTSDTESIEVGDIVLVHDEGKPRGFWKLARIEDLIIGKDGKTRGAVLRVGSSGERTTTLRRPVQRLYPLEIQAQTQAEEPVDVLEDDVAVEEVSAVATSRPRRAAAMRATDRTKALALYEQDDEL